MLQLEAGMATQSPAGSDAPAGTAEQVPCLPAIAHELHVPQDADPQQTPLVQWPLKQVAAVVQAVPLGWRFVQVPD